MFAAYAPAPFLSAVIADCIERGRDYYDGGARYNTDYIQCCGLGTTTDPPPSDHVFHSSLDAAPAHALAKSFGARTSAPP
jgi:formate C-acetyltransferase